ncbi:MAG: hypothetical protein ACRBN8_44770 [Nannocystales bacterium]
MSRYWPADAVAIPVDQLSDAAYLNKRLSRFMSSDTKTFLCGAKGMGKTMLLKYKRYELEKRYSRSFDGAPDVQFVPASKPYLDQMPPLATLSANEISFFGTPENARGIWELALGLSALSHKCEEAARPLLEPLFKASEPGPLTPTDAFSRLMHLGVQGYVRVRAQIKNELQTAVRKEVRDGLFMFVDRIDQALGGMPQEAWVNFQAGMLRASWQLMQDNTHIKVFGTIRQEAYGNMGKEQRANVCTIVTEVRYHESDLRRILDKLTALYEEDLGGFSGFVGFESVSNCRSGVREDLFDYVCRHTLGRPRDLVRVAEKLSELPEEKTEKDVVETVEEVSSSIAADEAFAEVQMFLDVLAKPSGRAEFFRHVGFPVLQRADVERVFLSLNRGVVVEDRKHPFFELYVAGLLGFVTSPGPECKQRFRDPGDPLPSSFGELPRSDLYVLHPGLWDAVAVVNAEFATVAGLTLGRGRGWTRRDSVIASAQRELWRIGSRRQNPELYRKLQVVLRAVAGCSRDADVMRFLRRSESWTEYDELRRFFSQSQSFNGVNHWLEELSRLG